MNRLLIQGILLSLLMVVTKGLIAADQEQNAAEIQKLLRLAQTARKLGSIVTLSSILYEAGELGHQESIKELHNLAAQILAKNQNSSIGREMMTQAASLGCPEAKASLNILSMKEGARK